jgi:hypothetical protein
VNDLVKTLGLQLAAALDFDVPPESFTDEAAWVLFARLESAVNQKRPLPPAALRAIEELSIYLNVRGGDERKFLFALEGQLGTSPFPVETIVEVVRYVRSQLHGFEPKVPKVQLQVKPVHVPVKSVRTFTWD